MNRFARRPLSLYCCALLLAACGPPGSAEAPSSGQGEVTCPAPIGTIERESCTATAEEFGALSVSGALQRAGGDKAAAIRVEAIRAAAGLANRLKEKRIAVCEAYNACAMTPQEHAVKDQALAGMMQALLDLWDQRQFADPGAVARFHAAVRAIEQQLEGHGQAVAATPGAPPSTRPAAGRVVPGDKLAQLGAQGATYMASGGGLTVRTQDGTAREVVRSAPELRLLGRRRYLVKVIGTYAPTSPPLLSPGDQIVGRVRFHARQAGDLYVALRSLDDPDASESTTAWHVAAGEKGMHEAQLTAQPGESGFYLAVGLRGGGGIALDDIELSRGGAVLAAARAEKDAEPMVKTTCAADASKPLAGKRSLRCDASSGDLVTIGLPTTYLELAIQSGGSKRAVLRTQSLDGGRSLDAQLEEEGELVISMAGAGTATLRTIEVREIEK